MGLYLRSVIAAVVAAGSIAACNGSSSNGDGGAAGSGGGSAGSAGGSGNSVGGGGGAGTGGLGGTGAGGSGRGGSGGAAGIGAGGGGAAGSSYPSGNVLSCFGACPMGRCDSVVAVPNEPSCSSTYPGPVGPSSTYCNPGASGSYCLETMGGIWGINCTNGTATLSSCGGACSTDGTSLLVCGSLTGSGGRPDGAAGSG